MSSPSMNPSIYPSLHGTPDTQSISPQTDSSTTIGGPAEEISIEKPADVKKSLAKTSNDTGKKVALRLLATLAGGALGVLTALALAGTMVTPIGWALAGGVLALTLIAAATRGGREFLNTLAYAGGAFGLVMLGLPSLTPGHPTTARVVAFLVGFLGGTASFAAGLTLDFSSAVIKHSDKKIYL